MDASEVQDLKENLEQGAKEEPLRPVAFYDERAGRAAGGDHGVGRAHA